MPQVKQSDVKKHVDRSNAQERKRVAKKYPGVKKFSEGERPESSDSYDEPVFDYETGRFHPENVDPKEVLDSLKAKQAKLKKTTK